MARTQAADFEQRREAIVEKAAGLFARAGFNGASLADLAAACDMSKSLLYHYYPSKEDILHAVMTSHIDRLVTDVDLVMARKANPAIMLDRLLHAFMHHYVGAVARQKVLLNELDNLPVDRREEIIGKQRHLIAAVQSLLTALHPLLASNPARARAQTMMIFGMINWTNTWYDPDGPVSVDEIADMALAAALAPLVGE